MAKEDGLTNMGRGRPEKFTQDEVIQAIRETKAIKSQACKRLGCSYSTLVRYLDEYPEVKRAFIETKEELKDYGESVIVKIMASSSHKDQLSATKYFLSTQARDRGWNERTEVFLETLKDIGDTMEMDLSKLSRDELLMLKKLREKAAVAPKDTDELSE